MPRRLKQVPLRVVESPSAENLRYCKGCCRFKALSCFLNLKGQRYTVTCDHCRFRERERFWKSQERKKKEAMSSNQDCFSKESSTLSSPTLSSSESEAPVCMVSVAPIVSIVPYSRWILQPTTSCAHQASLVWYGYGEP